MQLASKSLIISSIIALGLLMAFLGSLYCIAYKNRLAGLALLVAVFSVIIYFIGLLIWIGQSDNVFDDNC